MQFEFSSFLPKRFANNQNFKENINLKVQIYGGHIPWGLPELYQKKK